MILDRYEFIGFVDINKNRNCTSKSREYLGKERLIINYNIRINRRITRQPKKKKNYGHHWLLLRVKVAGRDHIKIL